MKRLVLCTALAGCAGDNSADFVVGPFTGEPRHFVVDQIRLPKDSGEAGAMADDLGGGFRQNQLGSVFGALGANGALNQFSTDIIAAGVIRSRVVIVADDLANDPTVGVSYLGVEGAVVHELGGTLVDGTFVSNRTRLSNHGGTANVTLPVFQDADPSTVNVIAAQMELVPDGSGGFDGILQGAVEHGEVLEATSAGVLQQLENAPRDHLFMWLLTDTNGDGTVTRDEVITSDLIVSFLAPDIEIGEVEATTIGFAFHLSPCASESDCPTAVPVNTCFDRVLDGDETALDCGGSCKACPAGRACAVTDDCQSTACTDNVCAPGTCSDGVLDNFEADVDCGRTCSVLCARGQTCIGDADCASQQCDFSQKICS